MIESLGKFLHYFRGVNRRTLRDIAALPPEAADWKTPVSDGEAAWTIPDLIAHIASARGFFANVYCDEGWIMPPAPDASSPKLWTRAVDESAIAFRVRLEPTPEEWLRRRVLLIDGDGTIAGWRILMMLIEHEVHHRSQIDAYAGLNGWSPPDVFDMSAEGITAREAAQRQRLSERDG